MFKSLPSEITIMRNGVWASRLSNNDKLPIGGSIINSSRTYLVLDYEKLDIDLVSLTNIESLIRCEKSQENKFAQKYYEVRQKIYDIFSTSYGTRIIDCPIEVLAVCFFVQRKVDEILQVDLKNPSKIDWDKRNAVYRGGEGNLSQTLGNSACAERAALGLRLLQLSDYTINSFYLGGSYMKNANNISEVASAHSFLIIDYRGEQFIFDIARAAKGWPALWKPMHSLSTSLLGDKRELLVKCSSVYKNTFEIWFGVSEEVAGAHSNLLF